MPITGSQPALMYALLGTARIGATRMGYVEPTPHVSVDGSPATGIVVEGMSITETMDQPTTAQMRVLWEPTVGQEVEIRIGSVNAVPRFTGRILRSQQIYLGKPANLAWDLSLIDHVWGLNAKKVSGHFTGTATAIARALIAEYAPDYTTIAMEEDLPLVDGGITITFADLTDALTRVGNRVGAKVRVKGRDVRLYLPPDTSESAPADLVVSNKALMLTPPMAASSDLSPMISRVLHEGRGSTALTEVAIGETILPVADASWYEDTGGVVVSGPQRIAYRGVQVGGAGSLVGPSVTPIVKPYTSLSTGGSLTAGAHQWAYTWVTGAGESLPSPLSVVQTARNYTPPTPGVLPSAYPVPSVDAHATYNYYADTAGLTIGESYTYRLAFITGDGTGVSDLGPESAAVTAVASLNNPAIPSQIIVTFDVPGNGHPSDGTLIRQVLVYRIENGSGMTELTGWSGDLGEHDVYLTTMVHVDNGGGEGSEYGAGGLYGPASSAAFFTADLYGIATGPTGTTQRKVYQTAAGGAQLKLMTTIANNTVYTATANAADGSLGANVPTTDTSGLSTAVGRVNAGSTMILTPATAGFDEAGGWAISGQQVIRYMGISGNYLSGIPETGPGSLVTPLNYGAPIDPAPALTGISRIWAYHPAIVSIVATESPDYVEFTTDTAYDIAVGEPFVITDADYKGFNGTWIVSAVPGLFTFRIVNNGQFGVISEGAGAVLSEPAYIRYTIPSGQDVNLLAQVDDFEAQATLAALLDTDGIIEAYLQDRRLSYDETYARGEAYLLERNQIHVAITYDSRDVNHRAGSTVHADVTAPTNVSGDFLVQSVTITFQATKPPIAPLCSVQAASVAFSWADLLRLES